VGFELNVSEEYVLDVPLLDPMSKDRVNASQKSKDHFDICRSGDNMQVSQTPKPPSNFGRIICDIGILFLPNPI